MNPPPPIVSHPFLITWFPTLILRLLDSPELLALDCALKKLKKKLLLSRDKVEWPCECLPKYIPVENRDAFYYTTLLWSSFLRHSNNNNNNNPYLYRTTWSFEKPLSIKVLLKKLKLKYTYNKKCAIIGLRNKNLSLNTPVKFISANFYPKLFSSERP